MEAVFTHCLPTVYPLMIYLEEKGFIRRLDIFQVAIRRHYLQAHFLS
jgi:hypothetical protein